MDLKGFRALQRSAILSRRLRGLDHDAERLYVRLILAVDPYGTTHADEALVQAAAAPGVAAYVYGDGSGTSIGQALDALDAAGLIVRWEHDGEPYLHIVDFDEHQLAEFKRKRGERTSPMPPADVLAAARGNVQGTREQVQSGAGVGPAPEPRTKNQEPEPIEPSCGLPAAAPTPERGGRSEDVRRVFEHWQRVEAETGGKGSKPGQTVTLTDDRRRKIEARLNEGISVEKLCRAIDGFARDPWHLGTNPRRRRYTDLVTTLKGGAKVDEGVALADASEKPADTRFAAYD